MQTITTIPTKGQVVRYDHADYGAERADGTLIRACRSQLEAQIVVDDDYAAQLAATPPDDLAADPCMPFGALGGPCADIAIMPGDLDRAYTRFCAPYSTNDPDHQKVLKRAEKAYDLVCDPTRWQILPDGSVEVAGSSSTYVVTDEACCKKEQRISKKTGRPGPVYCPDFLYRTGDRGGMCYHTIARELLRLAQAMAQCNTGNNPTPLATITVSAPALLGFFGTVRLACPDEPVSLFTGDDGLAVQAGDLLMQTTAPVQGAGGITLPAAAFADLWGQVRLALKEIPTVELAVFETALQLTGTGLHIRVQLP